MPDDSRAPVSFAEALRRWPEAELRKGEGDPQFGEAIRAELVRRGRPCTCCVWGTVPHARYRRALRACARHQGSPL